MSDPVPYKEFYDEEDGCWIRIFPGDLPVGSMKWHWDEEDRLFEIVEGTSWEFQKDNELPFKLKPGMGVKVEAGQYHRGIKPEKCEDLVIRMYKTTDKK